MSTKITTLSNGFRIVTHHIPYVETVSIGVWVYTGSRCETKKNNGIAHFLEHMAFKGTVTRSAFDIVQQIESVGGDLNASTSQDITCYHASLLKQDIHLGIDILADILQNSVFSEEEIEKERNVVLQEIDQTNDNPEETLFDQFQEAAFPNQSLGRPILGSKSNVKAFNKEMLQSFINQHYGPENMVFSAAGNLNHDLVVSYVKESFSGLTQQEKKEFQPAYYKGGYSHTIKKLEQQHFIIGFEGVALDSPEFYIAHCYSNLLGGGMSSRLFQEIREKRGLVYNISSFLTSYRDTGLLSVYTGTSEDKIEEIVQVILQEIENTALCITLEELGSSKNQLKAHILMAHENTSYIASTMARQILTFGKVLAPREIIKKIDAVNREDLMNYAKKLRNSIKTFSFMGSREQKISY